MERADFINNYPLYITLGSFHPFHKKGENMKSIKQQIKSTKRNQQISFLVDETTKKLIENVKIANNFDSYSQACYLVLQLGIGKYIEDTKEMEDGKWIPQKKELSVF